MKERCYFVSDVHLGLDVNDSIDREARFVGFLRDIPTENTEALYLLGDIWDFWYEYKDVVPKGYVRVFSELLNLMDAGVKVYFFRGNHDIWAYHYFESLGITILKQPCLIEIGGKSFCLGHGDGLGPGMRSYKLMRSIFYNKVLQALFSALHPRLAFAFGRRWSKRSRLARRVKYRFRGEAEPLYKFAVDYASTHKVDYFIFGHYHTGVDMTLPSGERLIVLDDWIDGTNYAYSYSDGISTFWGHSINREK